MDGATSPEKSCRRRKGTAILLVPRRQRDRDARVLRARDQASGMPLLRAVVLPGLGAIAVLAAAGRAIRMLDGDDPNEDRAVRGLQTAFDHRPDDGGAVIATACFVASARSWDGRDRRTCGGPSNLTQRRRSPPATRRPPSPSTGCSPTCSIAVAPVVRGFSGPSCGTGCRERSRSRGSTAANTTSPTSLRPPCWGGGAPPSCGGS